MFEGKVAVVTGAGGTLCSEIAKEIAKQVSEITSTNSWRYTFTEFLKSEWWTYDSQNQTITWGLKTNA